jgi:hypothetical protein
LIDAVKIIISKHTPEKQPQSNRKATAKQPQSNRKATAKQPQSNRKEAQ